MFGMVNSNNQADKNRDMQRYFAKNAHQVEAADLEAAGLNRTLTATGGPGAAVPSGSMPGMADIENPVSTAADIAIKRATLDNVKDQSVLLKEQAKKTAAETRSTAADTRILNARAEKEERTKGMYELLPPSEGIKSTARDMVNFYKGQSGLSPRGLFNELRNDFNSMFGGR